MLLAGRESQAELQALADSNHPGLLFLNNLHTFQGNPRVQFYENHVPYKSLRMQPHTAAG